MSQECTKPNCPITCTACYDPENDMSKEEVKEYLIKAKKDTQTGLGLPIPEDERDEVEENSTMYCEVIEGELDANNNIPISFTYMYQPPKRYTFQMPLLKQWIEDHCEGKVLNLFAGIVLLNVDETRNDIDTECPADYHMDVYEFIAMAKEKGMKFDTIVADPPYNMRKSREKYEGRWIGHFTKVKNQISDLLNDGGVIISLGYDSVGMSRSRGFRKEALCTVCQNGDHQDIQVIMERKLIGKADIKC